MTKAEIIAKMAKDAKISKASAAKAFAVITSSIERSMKEGGRLTLIGFGTFSVSSRKARKARNPRTGKEVKVPARKVPKFSAGTSLKKAVAFGGPTGGGGPGKKE